MTDALDRAVEHIAGRAPAHATDDFAEVIWMLKAGSFNFDFHRREVYLMRPEFFVEMMTLCWK